MYKFTKNDGVELIKKVYTPGVDGCFNGDSTNSKPVLVDDKYVLSTTASCGGIFNSLIMVSGLGSAGKVMGTSPYGDADKACTNDWFIYDESTDTWVTDNRTILNTYRRCYDDPNLNPQDAFGNQEFNLDTIANLAKKAQNETY